jgi:hypothetical protein
MPDDPAGQAEDSVLIISQEGRTPGELHRALRSGGFQVEVLAADNLSPGALLKSAPDIVMASASLGLQRLGMLEEHFAQRDAGERMPNIIVFAEDDLTALVDCVVGGFDYVTPPFQPDLLRSRMSSCGDRFRLQALVGKMAAEASLRDYEQQLSIAREIQLGFLPDVLPALEGWQIATRFRPAKEVAGDFYDVFELFSGQGLGLVVADVCDKGIGAALFMAIFRTLLRHTAEQTGAQPPWRAEARSGQSGEPGPTVSACAGLLLAAVAGTNRYMIRNHLRQGYFATVFFGILDPSSGELVYINGGHNPPVLVPAAGGYQLLQPTGPAVGMLPDSTFTLGQTWLSPGDALLIYTDGVTEARDEQGEMFGMNRLLAVAGQLGRTAEQLTDLMDQAVRGHTGYAEQADDITMLFMTRH